MATIQAKEVMPWLLLAGAGFAMYKFGDKLFGKAQSEKDLENTTKTVITEIDKQVSSGIKPSYGDSQYQTFADTLYNAMYGPGTDEEKIFSIISQIKNNVDVLKLVLAFGNRYYGTEFLPEAMSTKMNLGQWFREELSTSEIAKVNSILKANGINYQF